MKIISIDLKKNIPKYKQIVTCVEIAIMERRLKRGDRLPSLNKVALEHSMSRDTVMLAYEELIKHGILYSKKGKGYYVKSEHVTQEQHIFLLFDEFNSFKEDLYNSFVENMQASTHIDIFFHNFRTDLFQKFITENNGNYTKYIIMPTSLENAAEVIAILPKNKVFILDQTNENLKEYPSVHQNFVKDIYNALQDGYNKLEKYKKIILIDPKFKQPPGMKKGFIQFCKENSFTYEVVADFESQDMKAGDVFIIPNDRHLVMVIEHAKACQLKIGKDIGIISYNDTPLKKVLKNGITTISTDFKAMGRLAAEMVMEQNYCNIENKTELIIRESL